MIQMHLSAGTSVTKSHIEYIIRRREGGREDQFTSLVLRRGRDPRMDSARFVDLRLVRGQSLDLRITRFKEKEQK